MRTPAQIVTTVLILFSAVQAHAVELSYQVPQIQKSTKKLFSSFEALDVRIEAPFNELIALKSDLASVKKHRIQGQLFNAGKAIPIELRLRGNATLSFCNFPKFTIYFREDTAQGTVFEDLKKVDLGTHCTQDNIAESVTKSRFFRAMRFNHREALLYKWLEILEIPSYAARPAYVTYKDTSIENAIEFKEQGFFLEHLDAFLKRSNSIEIRAVNDARSINEKDSINPKIKKLYTNIPNHPQLDPRHFEQICFFNSFVENGDFGLSENEIWNVKLVELQNGSWLPVPMDFNYSEILSGPVTLSMNFDQADVYTDKQFTLQPINRFIAKIPELRKTLVFLKDDSEGLKNFQESLDRRAIALENLKNQLKSKYHF